MDRSCWRFLPGVGILLSVASASGSVTDAETRNRLIARAVEAVAAFDRATELLPTDSQQARAEFLRARDGFEALAAEGVRNGPLHYNLGNTYLRLGELGRALANYRIAQRYVPGDEKLRANLRFARNRRRDRIEASGEKTFARTLFFLHYNTAPTTRFALALGTYGLFWMLLAARTLRDQRRFGYAVFVVGVVCASLIVSVALSHTGDGQTEGVLVADEIVVRKGNGEGYAAQFAQPLHEGAEFLIVERRGGWLHIELPDGNRGWIRDRDAVLF